MVAVGLGVAALWRRVAGLSIALASVLGGVLMWQKLRFGASTVPTVWQLRQAISSGRPVLVEVFSDT